MTGATPLPIPSPHPLPVPTRPLAPLRCASGSGLRTPV
nr:MAG TPA: hypothetical protein [Caudoviricetes sp.]